MQELKIESVLEKVQIGEDLAMICKLETGAFAILCDFEGTKKVCFNHDSEATVDIYRKCVELLMGGPGCCWLN